MFITNQQYNFENFASEDENLKKFKKTMRFVFENDEKMNVNQKWVINNILRLIKNVIKAIFTLIKLILVEANENESAIKRKKFNESSFKRFILSVLKRFVFSVFKIESKDFFIFKNLFVSQKSKDFFIFRSFFASLTIFNNTVKSDDDLSTLLKNFLMIALIAFMLSYAKVYVKKIAIIWELYTTL